MLTQPEFRKRFEAQGALIVGNTPEEFARVIQADLTKWAAVVKASGAKLD